MFSFFSPPSSVLANHQFDLFLYHEWNHVRFVSSSLFSTKCVRSKTIEIEKQTGKTRNKHCKKEMVYQL